MGHSGARGQPQPLPFCSVPWTPSNGVHRRRLRGDGQAVKAVPLSSTDTSLLAITSCLKPNSCQVATLTSPCLQPDLPSLPWTCICLPLKWVCCTEEPTVAQGEGALFSGSFASLQSIYPIGFNTNGTGKAGKQKSNSALFCTQ